MIESNRKSDARESAWRTINLYGLLRNFLAPIRHIGHGEDNLASRLPRWQEPPGLVEVIEDRRARDGPHCYFVVADSTMSSVTYWALLLKAAMLTVVPMSSTWMLPGSWM